MQKGIANGYVHEKLSIRRRYSELITKSNIDFIQCTIAKNISINCLQTSAKISI